ncbi:hypothetical protein PG993_004714 [Apiospora rasikravindrae]|uniref:Uncharacterized protein n=1 Tax=Apiospora rasikravindrae TaxID=990691 RepID=A0ABR1TFJ5_9PEZI
MTMLLVNPQESHSHYYVNYRMPTPPSESSTILQLINMSSQQYQDSAPAVMSSAENNEVAQALEIARESPDGAKDPVVSSILENALVQIWTKVQAQPDSYVMSRDEFAVFNFFQYRFTGNKVAIAARKRYWDNTTGP